MFVCQHEVIMAVIAINNNAPLCEIRDRLLSNGTMQTFNKFCNSTLKEGINDLR